jgi:hypothetical protein
MNGSRGRGRRRKMTFGANKLKKTQRTVII